MKFILHLLAIFLLINLSSGRPNKHYSKRDTNDDNAWLFDLESQILTNSEEVNSLLTTGSKQKLPEIKDDIKEMGKLDNIKGDLFDEPVVITSKPYLTGDEIVEMEFATEKIPSELQTDSTVAEESTERINSETKTRKKTIPLLKSTTSPKHNGQQRVEESLEDENNSRKILDKILATNSTRSGSGNSKSSKSREDVSIGDSEVRTFVVLLKNQTPFIILGCIMSSLVLVALIFFAYQILKKINERSAITLISHYEYDINSRGITVQHSSEEKCEL